MKNLIKSIAYNFFEFISPNHCLVTDEAIPDRNSYFSQKAIYSMPLANDSITNLSKLNKDNLKEIYFQELFALWNIGDNLEYMNPIHDLKYNSMPEIGIELGEMLGTKILKEQKNPNYELIVPVPIHSAKKRERGYNQSDYLCIGISKKLNIPFEVDYMKRNFFTKTQTRLNRSERLANLKDAFSVNKGKEKVNSVLIVDEVFTTGSTVNQTAKALQNFGINKIGTACVALKF